MASHRLAAPLLCLMYAAPGLVAQTSIWKPAPNTSWQWQLQNQLDLSVDVEMYDIDLFDNDAATVAALHARGRKAVCYVSVGTFEPWRADASRFPESVKGRALEDFDTEKWLDIRRWDVLGPIMEARLDTCKAKGFDGVEPDNVDAYTNRSGFPLTAQDQLAFNIRIAEAAHARGLSVGLKNDLDQIPQLVSHFDWALNEQCFQYQECGVYGTFTRAGKAVFHVEYEVRPEAFCTQANSMNFNSLYKTFDLDAYRVACREPAAQASPAIGAVVNAAGYQSGGIAPGEIVAVFGSGLGPAEGVAGRVAGERFATESADGTAVFFDGQKAPLLFAQNGQMLAVAPYGVAGKQTVEVVVERGGRRSAGVRVGIVDATPALFTNDSSGKGPVAALNQDGSRNDGSRPARPNEIVVLFGTGEGMVTPIPADGQLSQAPLARPVLPVSVQIGGADAEVLYAGPAPGLVAGVLQLNVRVPTGVAPGQAVIQVRAGDAASPAGTTVAVGAAQ
ncbi:MAG: endo alpha-1,4 polygalactosaminidase [Bryobacteraceae bacterium]